MNGSDASYHACARIVAQAIRRIPQQRIGILDRDDLQQELIIHALKASKKADGREGHGYVRTTVHRAISRLWEYTHAACRQPQDQYGRAVWFHNPDVIDFRADDRELSPECAVGIRRDVEALIETLPPSERELVRAAARGEIELTERQAQHIRYCDPGGPE